MARRIRSDLSRSDSSRSDSSRSVLGARASACAASLAASLGLVVLPPGTAEARPAPQVSYTDSRFVAGKRVLAKVDPDSVPRGSRVLLQRRFPDRWRTADDTASTSRKGTLRFRVPSDQFGGFTYRVVAREGGRVVARSESHRVRVETGYDPRGRSSQYELSGDRRTRWDSCRTLRWTFNPAHAPDRALRQLKAGVRRIHRGTGLEFDYVGKTMQKPNPYGSNLKGADIILGWRTPSDYRLFADNPRVLGVGGTTSTSGYRDAEGAVNRVLSGGVVFNAGWNSTLERGFGRGQTQGEVIIHELGHVVGLAHTASRKQIMYYASTDHDADWGAGDLHGLRRVGDTRGCLERSSSRVAEPRVWTWRAF